MMPRMKSDGKNMSGREGEEEVGEANMEVGFGMYEERGRGILVCVCVLRRRRRGEVVVGGGERPFSFS